MPKKTIIAICILSIVILIVLTMLPLSIANNSNEQIRTEEELEQFLINTSSSKIIRSGEVGVFDSSNYLFDYQNASTDNRFSLVCFKDCPINKDLLDSHFNGLDNGYTQMYSFIGIKPLQNYSPVYYNPRGNSSLCMSAEEMNKTYGFITGYSYVDSNTNKGVICNYDSEKTNTILPYNKENAIRIPFQLLAVHEMTHLIFTGRSNTNYEIQESFAKSISFKISGIWDGNGLDDSNFKIPQSPCSSENSPSNYGLVYRLCKNNGLSWDNYKDIFTQMDSQYQTTGKPITNLGFKKIVDNVLKTDTKQAFIDSGIPICSPNWILNDTWSECINNIRYKNYIDANNCSEVPPSPINETCNNKVVIKGALCGNVNKSGQGLLCNNLNPKSSCPEGYYSTYINSNGGEYRNYHCVSNTDNSNLQVGALCGYANYNKNKGWSTSIKCNGKDPKIACPQGYILNSVVQTYKNNIDKQYSCVRNSSTAEIFKGMLCGRANYNRYNGWSGSILCNGYNPKTSCPKNFTRTTIVYNSGIDTSYFCVLNSV